MFSVPVTFALKGYWSVVQDIELTDESKEKLQGIIQVWHNRQHSVTSVLMGNASAKHHMGAESVSGQLE